MNGAMNDPTSLLKPKRGRPSAARAGALDRHVVEVARRKFLAEGYDAVSIEQVAAEAKVSKGTVYARHPSKEALFSAVVAAMVKQWSQEAALRDDTLTDNIEQRLRHHAQTIVSSLQRPDVLAMQRLILSLQDRFPEASKAMYDHGYRYIVDLICRDVREAAEREGSPARDPMAVAQLLVNAITGRQFQESSRPEIVSELPRYAERVVDLIMAARRSW